MTTTLRNDRCCLGPSQLHRSPPRLTYCHGVMAPGYPSARELTLNTRAQLGTTSRSFGIKPKRSVSCLATRPCVAEGDGNTGGGCGGGMNRGGGGGKGDNGDGHDNFGDQSPRFSSRLTRAVLGALALTAAAASSPAPSRATPGSLAISPNTNHNFLGGSYKDSPLSSSAPTRGGGLADSLDRLSFDPSHGGRGSSSGSSPSRPRSKVLHVSCKGGTLVVPLPAGGDGKAGPAAAAMPRVAPWQRKKVVEAPIELSEREARMLASRQNRVRDSLLVQ